MLRRCGGVRIIIGASLLFVAPLGLVACTDGGTSAAPTTVAATTVATTMATTTTAAPITVPQGPGCALLPASGPGAVESLADQIAPTAAAYTQDLTTWVSAVRVAGLIETLSGPGPFTVFAPSNDAFSTMDKTVFNQLLADPNGQLRKVLESQVVAGLLDPAQLLTAGQVTTSGGTSLRIGGSVGALTINDVTVRCGNLRTANATIYILDAVLLPTSP